MSTAWARFFVLYAIQFLQLIDFMSIGPTGAVFHKGNLIESTTIAFSITAYSIAAIIGSLLIRKIGDPNGIVLLKKLLFLFSISQLVLLIGINDQSFIFARVLGGLTGGIIGAIAYSKLHLIDDGKNTGLWNGRVQTAQSLITLIGIPLCLFIITKLNIRFYYLLTFILSLVLPFSLNGFRSINEKIEIQKPKFNINENLDIISTGFLCYLSAFLFITNLPNYLLSAKSISTDQLSIGYTISGITTILFSGFLGKIADKINPKKLLMLSIVLITFIQIYYFSVSSLMSIYMLLPVYLLLSTSRMIYQRSIILKKKNENMASMHLLNNISIRSGILFSGLVIGFIGSYKSIEESIYISNKISIYVSIATFFVILWFLIKENKGLFTQQKL